MHKKQSLNLIFKVIRVKNGSNETIGTAFIVNDNYAITACHVLKQCLEYKYFLESYDGCVRIDDLEHYCSVYNPEYYIDISIIKLNKNLNNFNKYISICNDCINTGVEYYTYGYPELANDEELFISGKLLSPEGRLSIHNSSGDIDGISLYNGISGAPLIINDMIYGLISNEIPSTLVTKPELITMNIYNLNIYLEGKENLNKDEEKLMEFIAQYSISNKIIDKDIDPLYKQYDNEVKQITNKKNLDEKIKSVCPEISEGILKSWRRKCVNARIELETLNSNQRKDRKSVV